MSEPRKNGVAAIVAKATQAWTSATPRPRRRSIVREFALNTSAPGISSIARSGSKLNCLFRTVSFVIFTGVMMYFITQSIRHYFQYPTQTAVSVVIDQQAAFPAVTICNYSPFRSDRVLEPLLNYTNALNITNTTDPMNLTPQQLEMLPDFLIEKSNGGASVKEYFFSLAIMLLGCEYNGIPCAASDFRSFLSSMYGLCYTFNTKVRDVNASRLRSITDNAGTGRLLLHLYAHSHLYVPSVSRGQFTVMMSTSETLFSFV